MSYEFLIAGLPDLKKDTLLSTEALTELLEEQLCEKDKRLWWCLVVSESESESESGVERMLRLAEEAKNEFLRAWFGFNRDLNNILTAAICRKHNLNLREQIKVESEKESERLGVNSVAQQILSNPNAKDFGLTGTTPIVEQVLRIAAMENLLEREKAIDAIREAWLEERTMFDSFGIEKVLAYWLQNEILHRWDKLTMETGERVFRELVNDMKKSIKI